MNETSIILYSSIIMFAIGLYGLTTRRNAIRMLISIEILLNAANLNIINFAHRTALTNAMQAQVLVLFSIALAAIEAAIGIGIFINLYRIYGEAEIDIAKKLREV
ncbi:MAG: NADH-quinone oxidoreductase subunit NuoK [Candidatus Njordarchaeales archaeon]